jgi:hypothetical protein
MADPHAAQHNREAGYYLLVIANVARESSVAIRKRAALKKQPEV